MSCKQSLFPLRGSFQTYSWGDDSESSHLRKLLNEDPNLPKNCPLAELWLGNHPNGESLIFCENQWDKISNFLSKNSSAIPLNFLAKILNIKQPLSIQLHPSKNEAIRLHKENPFIFPDNNSKPEMAIALSPLKLLCGVRHLDDIKGLITTHAAFQKLSDLDLKNAINQSISTLFRYIFSLNKNDILKFADEILKIKNPTDHDNVAIKFIKSSANLDSGIIALYLLEYLEIPQFNAIFIKPNIPHAYIEGNAFECMQNSDNVVRGGLTSKVIDIKNFCELVDTNPYKPDFNPIIINNNHSTYLSDELPFQLDIINIKKDDGIDNFLLPNINNHEILFVLDGIGEIKLDNKLYDLRPGLSYYSIEHGDLNIISNSIKIFRVLNLINH